MLEQKLLPATIVSVHSPRWQSKIRKAFAPLGTAASIDFHLTVDDAIAAANTSINAEVIAELPATFNERPDATLASIASACNNPFAVSIFLLGDESHESWTRLLIEAGAIETCFCMLDFEHFMARIQRCLNHHSIDEIPVEQAVAARLRQ